MHACCISIEEELKFGCHSKVRVRDSMGIKEGGYQLYTNHIIINRKYLCIHTHTE